MTHPHSLPAGKWQQQNRDPELSSPLGFGGLTNVVGKVGGERGAPIPSSLPTHSWQLLSLPPTLAGYVLSSSDLRCLAYLPVPSRP